MRSARPPGRGALPGQRPRIWVVFGLLSALVVALSVAITRLPAVWLDQALNQASLGRFRIAQAEGTVWQGHGSLVLADPKATDPQGGGDVERLVGLSLPGRLGWQVEPFALLQGQLKVRLTHDRLQAPVMLELSAERVMLSAGTLTLPRLALDRLGSPWNTIQPAAGVTVDWSDAVFRAGRLQGRSSVVLAEVSAALTPVNPLGSYHIEIMGSTDQTQIRLTTRSGPLQLTGSGHWTASSGLKFQAEAWADGPEQARLQSLLGLMGRREGDRVRITLGA